MRGSGGNVGVVRATSFRAHPPRETEIENLASAVAREKEVLRLQIAVDDPFVVSRGQRSRDLDPQTCGLGDGERTARQGLVKALSLEELRDQIGDAALVPDVVYRENVRMVQSRSGPCFELETPGALGIGSELSREDFDGDFSTEPAVTGPVNLAHSTRTDARNQLVGP